jgi:hypothetical protein
MKEEKFSSINNLADLNNLEFYSFPRASVGMQWHRASGANPKYYSFPRASVGMQWHRASGANSKHQFRLDYRKLRSLGETFTRLARRNE